MKNRRERSDRREPAKRARRPHLLRLLGYVWPLRWRMVLIVLLSAVVAVLSVTRLGSIGPLLLTFFGEQPPAEIVSLGRGGMFATLGERINQSAQPLLQWGRTNKLQFTALLMGFLAVLTFIRGTAAFFQDFLAGMLSARVGITLANELYDHTLHLSVESHTRQGIADPVTRFTVDIDSLRLGVATLFGKTIQEPVTFVVCLAVLVGISPKLTLAVFIIVPLLVVVAALIGKQVRRAARNFLAVRSRLTNQLQQTFRGIRIVKAFVTEAAEVRRFRALNRERYRQRRRMVAGEAAAPPLLELLGVIGASVVIVLAAQAQLGGRLQPTAFITFVASLALAMAAVRKLSNVYNRMQIMLAAADRVFELRDQIPTVQERPDACELPPLRQALRFEGVHFSYDGEEDVLRGVDLEARYGERIALVGASGVGKTTLVNLIPRFYDPRAGRLTVDGTDVRLATLKSLRGQIGLVTQEVLLFDDTVRANIAYGDADASDQEIEEAARKAHADDFIRELPRGYDTVIGEDAATLSGGQRQRIALARAILKDPSIFILDEATSQLDSESEHHIQQALEEFMRGRTTFIIAHRLSTVEHADKIVVMEEGRVADVGTHAELLERSPLYRRLYHLQFGG